jgi:hypothetical protein
MTIDSVEMISSTTTDVVADKRSILSLLFPIFDRPLGVGFMVGLLVGLSNSLILNIPLVYSLISGISIGLLVCLIGCPAMVKQLIERRELERSRKAALARKARIISAFTSID